MSILNFLFKEKLKDNIELKTIAPASVKGALIACLIDHENAMHAKKYFDIPKGLTGTIFSWSAFRVESVMTQFIDRELDEKLDTPTMRAIPQANNLHKTGATLEEIKSKVIYPRIQELNFILVLHYGDKWIDTYHGQKAMREGKY